MATVKKFNAIDRIGEIAGSFGQAMDKYSQVAQQSNAQTLQNEALRRQKAIQGMEVEAKLTEQTGKNAIGSGLGEKIISGQIVPEDAFAALKTTPKFEADQNKSKSEREKAAYEADQRSKPVTERDDYIKAAGVAKIRGEAQAVGETRRAELERNKKLEEAKIPDFDIADPTVIPSTKDAEEIKKLNGSNKSFQEIGQSSKELLKKANPRDPRYYMSNDWRLLNQGLTKMKLQAKNLEDLGVLNGPDLSLVNETLGGLNPTNLALLGPEKAAERLQAALDSANKVMNNAASARNYKPKGQGVSAPAAPKQGHVEDGYIFLGGDPKNPQSWAKANS